MKICPICQTTYADDSNLFCLNDGTTLVEPQNLRQPQTQTKSSLPLVLAILAGFAIFAVIVGAVGFYSFTRGGNSDKTEKSNANANVAAVENQNKAVGTVNSNRMSSVEIETNRPASNAKALTSPAAQAPPMTVASASSVRKQDKGNFYFPSFAFDKNSNTAWCEGASGAGVGEWIDFQFHSEVRLRQIKIQPGYFKTSQIWRDNNRVAAALIEFSDGTSQTARFSDEMQTQTIEVGAKQTRWLRITIEDVYEGAHDSEDTLVSEVSFITEP
jgi:hypothetical protein